MSVASNFERQMLDLINAERTSRGLDPVALELRLNASSEDHSTWMLDRDVFSHTGSGGSSAGDRMRDAGFQFSGSWTWGENIAWQSERGAPGIADDVADLHRGLMNSPGHRANILNPDFEVIGLGIEVGNFEGYEAVMVTQNFARTGAPVQLDTGGTPPPENARPVAKLQAVELDAGDWETIGSRVRYSDSDGDAAVQFEVRGGRGYIDVRVDGEIVDMAGGHRFSASDLATLEIRARDAGVSDKMKIRAYDGESWGNWDGFRVTSAEDAGNSWPIAKLQAMTVTPGEWISVGPRVHYRDADGDRAVKFEIRDPSALFEIRIDGAVVDARSGHRFSASDLDSLQITADHDVAETVLGIRAFDGENWGKWDGFRVSSATANEDEFVFSDMGVADPLAFI